MIAVTVFPSAAFAASHTSCSGSDCLVCEIADLINGLPAAGDITLENATTVIDRIHAIDRIKMTLTDDQYDELLTLVERGSDGSGSLLDTPIRYTEAVEVIKSFGGCTLYPAKKFVGADGSVVDVSKAEVQLRITNVATDRAQTVTMSTMGYLPNALSADTRFYQANSDGSGWRYGYILPAGTYRIEEISDSGATVNGKPFVTQTRLFTVDGQQSENSVTVTVKDGESLVATLSNTYDPLVIIAQPQDQSVKAGEDATFSVTAQGAGRLTYQWQINNGARSENWTDISGAVDASYTVTSVTLADNGKQFRCVIQAVNGNTVTDAATLHVTEDAPIPETGDGMELFVFAGLAAMALVGMTAMKKREQN